MAVIGHTLLAESTAASTYYSPWFPRGGNLAAITCNVIASAGLTSFKVQAEHKNMDEGDNSAASIGADTTCTPAPTATRRGRSGRILTASARASRN